WQLTLPEPGMETCVELWPMLGRAGSFRRQEGPPVAVGLFVKGKAQLQVSGQTLDLGDKSMVSWVNAAGAVPQKEVLPQLPTWWTSAPDRNQPLVADAMLTLIDWSNQLNRSTDVVDTILTRIRESNDSTMRKVGLLFLAALDCTPFLVEFLEDRQHE